MQNAMEEKDFYTAGHTMRVTEYAVLLGLSMQIPEQEMVIDFSCIQKPG